MLHYYEYLCNGKYYAIYMLCVQPGLHRDSRQDKHICQPAVMAREQAGEAGGASWESPPCPLSCQRQTYLESSMYMEHKTSLPTSLKIIQEEENVCGKGVCKAMKEQELLKIVQMEETIENGLPLLSNLLNVI